jgi:hypothetical protein
MVKEVMTLQSLHAVNASLQAVPVAVVLSSKLLLTWTMADQKVPNGAAREKDLLTLRATKVTTILQRIQGYNHGGLND